MGNAVFTIPSLSFSQGELLVETVIEASIKSLDVLFEFKDFTAHFVEQVSFYDVGLIQKEERYEENRQHDCP